MLEIDSCGPHLIVYRESCVYEGRYEQEAKNHYRQGRSHLSPDKGRLRLNLAFQGCRSMIGSDVRPEAAPDFQRAELPAQDVHSRFRPAQVGNQREEPQGLGEQEQNASRRELLFSNREIKVSQSWCSPILLPNSLRLRYCLASL